MISIIFYLYMYFGKYTYGEPTIHRGAKLVVGNFEPIADNCNVYSGGNHRCKKHISI